VVRSVTVLVSELQGLPSIRISRHYNIVKSHCAGLLALERIHVVLVSQVLYCLMLLSTKYIDILLCLDPV